MPKGVEHRVLLTGVTGFAGSCLAETLLAERTHELFGLARAEEWPSTTGHLADHVKLFRCDLCAVAQVEQLLREIAPQQVYHLAGYAQVGRSFQEGEAAWQGNLTATRCLYDAVARWGGQPRILAVGSGLIYGDPVRPDQILDEDTPLRPNSPYATSKAAADLVGYQYTRSHGLDIVRARPFNHIGPRQSPQFAIASFARQLAEIVQGKRPPVLETGNLGSSRDLTDVRDVAAAYVLLMQQGRTGEAYNVGSGVCHSIGAVLDQLVELAGVHVEVRQRADLLRSADPPALLAGVDKIRRETGWSPRYSLKQSLLDTLEYWRRA